jgi:hypothetical protein
MDSGTDTVRRRHRPHGNSQSGVSCDLSQRRSSVLPACDEDSVVDAVAEDAARSPDPSPGRQRPRPAQIETEFTHNRNLSTRSVTPSIMSIRNKPPPIDTLVNVPEFEWAHALKPNPKRSAFKFGLALLCFALAAWILSLDVGLSTRLMLRFWPNVYKQDTSILAADSDAIEVRIAQYTLINHVAGLSSFIQID